MREESNVLAARISAEMFAAIRLSEACEWLIQRQNNSVPLEANELPGLGRHSWLMVARPITAPRAVLCTVWLIEEIDGGGCLVAGTLRFVEHPTAADVRLSFDGRAVSTGRGDTTARDLLELIVAAIGRGRNGAYGEIAS